MSKPPQNETTVERIVAWMRQRAEPQPGDNEYHAAWRDGVREMAAEVEANEFWRDPDVR